MRVEMLDSGQSAVLTAALVGVAGVCSLSANRRVRALIPFAVESALIAGLYSLWQLAGRLSVVGTQGAFTRAHWIVRTERDLHLPDEADLQHVLIRHATVAHVADLYYATMHFTIMFVFLVWLFVRHREHYRPVRRILALTTLLCLVIQLLPVAPPRLLHSYGFVDVALHYGQSVYGLGFDADQLSAMPSVHVAWAALVGWTVWRVGSGPGRIVGPLHTVLTVLIVVATGNHYWADGIVAVALIVLSTYACRAATRLLSPLGARVRARVPEPAQLSSSAASGILP